jgi:uncharacterized protein YijF (DUF1287 family)
MRSRAIALALLVSAVCGASAHADTALPEPVSRAVVRAREEVTRGVAYDGSYRTLTFRDGRDTGRFTYPGGDVDPSRGVCTDVVVRGLRSAGLDLQPLVHADVLAHPDAYAPFVRHPDANIDHRRVGPLMTYFGRHAASLPRTVTRAEDRATFLPGDVIVWTFGGSATCFPNHIGLVSDRRGPRGLPLVLHNLGPHPTEDDMLDAWVLLGHYRPLK